MCSAGCGGGSRTGPRQCQQHAVLCSSHQAGGQTPRSPCRFHAKFIPWSKNSQEGLGCDGLGERLCGAPIRSVQSPLPGPGGGEGEELLYKQLSKMNCFSSLEQEMAFQSWDTMRVCSDCIFSQAVYSQGAFVRDRLRFLGEMNQALMCSILPRLETVMMLMVVITVCLQLEAGCLCHIICLLLGFCALTPFVLLLVMVCCCLLCPDLADKSQIFDRAIHMSEVLLLTALVPF